MINNLRVLKKELKSFAKRVNNFKYTESALIIFLLTGLIELTGVSFNLFSAENEIQAQTKAINTSITSIKSDFRFARHENNKLLKKANLELVKLMEQGDHVVKSPWSMAIRNKRFLQQLARFIQRSWRQNRRLQIRT